VAEEGEESEAEKTEDATAKRIQKAAEEGQVALSREAVSFAALLSAAIAGALTLPGAARSLIEALRGTFARSHEIEAGWAAAAWLWLFLGFALPVGIGAALGAIAATLAQTRGAVSPRPLIPDLAKLSPLAGFGRLFGTESLFEFLRTLLKLLVVGAALWLAAADLPGLGAAVMRPEAALLTEAGHAALRLLGIALAAFALIAIGDVLLTRFRHLARLRMTRQEVKEEMKESDGDPVVKGRQRQLREAKGRQRMMAAVPRAAVVITNPTHYAVALAYEAGQSAAPKVVAKGVDTMAARIRDVAREAGVPLMADPPLARALYRLELDTEIPPEHWDAVARIIAFVLGRRRR
jgi:flagellar biosynthetic protein FlhB